MWKSRKSVLRLEPIRLGLPVLPVLCVADSCHHPSASRQCQSSLACPVTSAKPKIPQPGSPPPTAALLSITPRTASQSSLRRTHDQKARSATDLHPSRDAIPSVSNTRSAHQTRPGAYQTEPEPRPAHQSASSCLALQATARRTYLRIPGNIRKPNANRQYEFRPRQPAALPAGPGQQGRRGASQVGRDRVQGETGGALPPPFFNPTPLILVVLGPPCSLLWEIDAARVVARMARQVGD